MAPPSDTSFTEAMDHDLVDVELGSDDAPVADFSQHSTITTTSHAVEDASSTSSDHHNGDAPFFVDYVPPPTSPSVPPPAKYKLYMIVVVCVYFAEWFAAESGFRQFIADTLHLSFNTSVLVVLGTVVAVMVFGTLDLIIGLVKIKIGDQEYGIEAWLKQPRTKWIHAYNNFFATLAGTIIVTLEDGLDLFNTPCSNNNSTKKQPPKQFSAASSSSQQGEVVLRVEHHIRKDKMEEFQAWRRKMLRVVQQGSRPEILAIQKANQDTESHANYDGDDDDDDAHVTYIAFSSMDKLNEYMTSPFRARMMKRLQPLLEAPSVLQLAHDRVLPDCFTDLTHGQGKRVPQHLPKKWKVWCLTTAGLWLAFFLTKSTLPHYYQAWGLGDPSSRRLQALVSILIRALLNTYIILPFLTMLFCHWIKRKENEMDVQEPWRTLNDGFQSKWPKFGLTLALYGGLGLAWFLQSRT